jgi:anaerobic magnesium-protoporphyrin IX monomethyl ester cyclase
LRRRRRAIWEPCGPPANLGYLAQALADAGIEFAVEDMRTSHTMNGLARKLRTFQPDLVGISVVSLQYLRAYEVARYVKQHAPQAAVVAGGPHISAVREQALHECAEIDFGIVQEGEASLVQLCRANAATPVDAIPGLLLRRNDAVLAGAEAVCHPDLDAISFPRFERFDLSRYAREIPIITSRGCPYNCIFCFHGVLGHNYRARSAANVVDELEHWYAARLSPICGRRR